MNSYRLTGIVVFDKARLLEAVHKKANPGSGGTHHFCERFVIQVGDDSDIHSFPIKVAEGQQNPRQSFFAGIAAIVHQVFLIADVSFKHVSAQ